MIIGKSDFIYFLILLDEKTKTSSRKKTFSVDRETKRRSCDLFRTLDCCYMSSRPVAPLRITGGSKEYCLGGRGGRGRKMINYYFHFCVFWFLIFFTQPIGRSFHCFSLGVFIVFSLLSAARAKKLFIVFLLM